MAFWFENFFLWQQDITYGNYVTHVLNSVKSGWLRIQFHLVFCFIETHSIIFWSIIQYPVGIKPFFLFPLGSSLDPDPIIHIWYRYISF